MTSVSEFFVKIQPILFYRLELCIGGPIPAGLNDLSIALNVIRIEKYGYELMDAAYDSAIIRQECERLGW